MCGIAGALIYKSGQSSLDLLSLAVSGCRERGSDSFGFVRWSPMKGWAESRYLSCSPSTTHEILKETPGEAPAFYLHTSRAEPTTEWKAIKTDTDIPPFRCGSVAVAHNGIICNDRELAERHGIVPASTIDTAVLPPLIGKIGVWETIREIEGGAALGIIEAERERLIMCRNFLPLVLLWQPGMVVFVSEAETIHGIEGPFPPFRKWELPPFSILELSRAGYRGPFSWGESGNTIETQKIRPWPDY